MSSEVRFLHEYECRRVLKWLQANPEGGQPEAIEAGIGDGVVELPGVRAALAELQDLTLVVEMKAGTWQATPAGREFKLA